MTALARLSLANRALVALAAVLVAVFGVLSATSLRQELIPDLEIPVLAVVTADPGSSPEVVDAQVSEPLAAAVTDVDGLVSTSSTSSSGLSVVQLELDYGTDLDRAQQQVQAALARTAAGLPDGAEPQVVAGSLDDLPVVQLSVTSDLGPTALAAALEDRAVPLLRGLEGVRDVSVSGAVADEVVITPDARALAAAGLGVPAIAAALTAGGTVVPAGSLTEGGTTLPVAVGTPVTSVADLRSLPVGPGTTLDDVADVEQRAAPATSVARTDGEPSLALAVTKTPDGNTVDVSHAVDGALPSIATAIGSGTTFGTVFDQAPFIEQSVEDLTTEGLLGLFFAVVVILVFLLSWRSTLVTALSIPLSVLATFIGLRVFGYSLNILTLGALTVAVGRVVDDSIVVIENVNRHLSYGEGRVRAVVDAVREVAGAVTASTLTTVAVFVPIALVGGQVGELFRPFALTVTLALLSSLVVSLTVVPVLASWVLPGPAGDVDADAVRAGAEAAERRSLLQRGYLPVLGWALGHPVLTLAAAVVLLAGTLGLATQLQTNFIGGSGQNSITVTQALPAGASLAARDAAAGRVEEELAGIDGVQTVQTTIGSSDGATALFGGGGDAASFAVTTDPDVDQDALQDEVRERLTALGAGDVTVSGGGSGFGATSVDVVVTAGDEETLRTATDRVLAVVTGVEGATEVSSNLAAAQPTVQVAVDRAAAAAAGLTEASVGQAVAGALRPTPLGQLQTPDGELAVVLSAGGAPGDVAGLAALPLGPGLTLADVARVAEVDGPVTVTRSGAERTATVSTTPAGEDLGSFTTALTAALDGADLPAGAATEVGGVSADQDEAFGQLGLALLVAVAIVYLLMVATFRSLLQPLVLLVSIPFAATGAIVLLLVTGTPLGVPSLIGLLMLVGIVVTNAIVLIDLVNTYRAAGRDPHEAVVDGARQRLRPILMTAAATVFALTPMALGLTGGGGFIAQPLAVVVIGGLVSSTLLTLVLVPVLDVLLERGRERFWRRRGRSGHAVAGPVAPAPRHRG